MNLIKIKVWKCWQVLSVRWGGSGLQEGSISTGKENSTGALPSQDASFLSFKKLNIYRQISLSFLWLALGEG